MRPPSIGARLAGLGAALVLLIGCTSQPAPTPSSPDPVPAQSVQDVNAQPRERLRDGGLLRLSIGALPTQGNARHPDAVADTASVVAPLMPAHFTLDEAGRASANPDFITAQTVDNDDVTTVTLRLHPSAQWGDGTPLTAEDWVATWRAASGQVAGVTLAGAEGWDRVAEVRVGDSPYEVVVTYTGIDPDWAEPLVAGPVRASDAASADAFSWTDLDASHYAGPFTVTHVDAVQGLVTLERNPLWWGDTARLERIMFRVLPEKAVAAAFQHNELDAWETGASPEYLQKSRAAADADVRTAPGTTGRALQISRAGVLADDRLRTALLLALDREELGAADLFDTQTTWTVWSNGLLLPTQPGYVDQAKATGLDHDPDQAATLLEEAGWVLEGGVRTRGGEPLVVTVAVASDDALAAAEFDALADQLGAVGIAVEQVAADADLTPVTVAVSAFPLAHLPAAATADAGASDLVSRVSSEVDPVRRADQASQLARMLWQEVTEIPLYQTPQFVAVRNGLANFGAQGYGTIAWEDVGWTS